MTVNNSNFDEIWLDVESQLLKVDQEIQSEARMDIESQVSQAVTDLQRETAWIQRLHVGNSARMNVAGHWFHGNVQHACPTSVVLLMETAITIINSDAVQLLTDVEELVSTRQHSELRCWNSVLEQVHDVTVLHHEAISVGSIGVIGVDAFDLRTSAGLVTLPWKHVSYVQVAL